jgi:hypothetical protein
MTQKEIERALLRGESSLINQFQPASQNILDRGSAGLATGSNSWSQNQGQGHSFALEDAEAEDNDNPLAFSSYDTKSGTVISSSTVSKTAQRKGQLSSLAANAKNIEQKVLIQGMSTAKTKKQTNAKYGW